MLLKYSSKHTFEYKTTPQAYNSYIEECGAQHSAAQRSTAQHSAAQRSTAQHSAAQLHLTGFRL
jgi:hypothetical protein